MEVDIPLLTIPKNYGIYMSDEHGQIHNPKQTKNEAVGAHQSSRKGLSDLPPLSVPMYRGYIKLWRKTKDWAFAQQPLALALWVTILREAPHKTTKKIFKGKVVDLNPGQFITGRKYLAELVGISEYTVEKYLKMFVEQQQIQQEASTRNRLITIVNWRRYQGESTTDQTTDHTTKKQQTIQQKNTSKNDKNDKKNIYSKEGKVLLTDKEYVELCKRLGKDPTDKLICDLEEYSFVKPKKFKEYGSHYRVILKWSKDRPGLGRRGVRYE